MSILHAILLGIIQGLTEFLPISSTAHLTIAGKLMGLISPEHPEQWTAFIAVIQLGTLAAVLLYFARDIGSITRAFLQENLVQRTAFTRQSINSRMGWYVIIGSLPIVIIGIALKKLIEGSLTKELSVIAASLIILAIILWIAERVASFSRDIEQITWKDALLVGLAQCIALVPGASRSGTTITAGLFVGLRRDTAARFSFLLSIPAVLGSGLLEFYQSLDYLASDGLIALVIATLVSAISGYATIALLLRFLRTHTTTVFIIYRILLGILLFWLLWTGYIS
jgi:undecaprenyl-diphosphatase